MGSLASTLPSCCSSLPRTVCPAGVAGSSLRAGAPMTFTVSLYLPAPSARMIVTFEMDPALTLTVCFTRMKSTADTDSSTSPRGTASISKRP